MKRALFIRRCAPAPVVRALGMIVGKLVRDGGDRGDRGNRGDLTKASYFLLTATITQASQRLVELLELTINT